MTTAVSSTSQNNYALSAAAQSASKSMGKDDFLKLLTYQLKAQDPMQPYDNQQFAAQLAQFSQLEQLTNISSLMEEQVTSNQQLSKTISNSAIPGMLGKTAKATTNQINFDGSNPVQLGYNLPYSASAGKILIKDSAGNIVQSFNVSGTDLSSGDHKFSWDGTNLNGNKAGTGSYNIEADFADGNGNPFTGTTFTSGKIDAVRFKTEGTMLVINGMEIPLDKISDITTGN